MPETKINKKSPHLLDVQIGKKVRAYRLMKGLSQEELGVRIGVTFQQVQKYERGTNRMAIGRLLDISKALNIPLMNFLDDGPPLSVNKKSIVSLGDPLTDRSLLGLIQSYANIQDGRLKQQLLQLARTMAANTDRDEA